MNIRNTTHRLFIRRNPNGHFSFYRPGVGNTTSSSLEGAIELAGKFRNDEGSPVEMHLCLPDGTQYKLTES